MSTSPKPGVKPRPRSMIDPMTGYDRRDASPQAQAAYNAAIMKLLGGR